MTVEGRDVRMQIASSLDALRLDREGSKTLFEYVWTIMCVRRGLLRMIEDAEEYPDRIVVEEVGTGNRRCVSRPRNLDPGTESLAVRALSHLIEVSRIPR